MLVTLLIAVVLPYAGPAAGPRMMVSPASTYPGERARMDISVETPAAQRPATLAFEVIYPAEAVTLPKDGPAIAPAAARAGKSLGCTGRWVDAPRTYAYRCILTGGLEPLPNGPAAILEMRARPTATPGSWPVRVHQIEGATAAVKEVRMPDAVGRLTIRAAGQ